MRPRMAIEEPTWLIKLTPASRLAVPAPTANVAARPIPSVSGLLKAAMASWAVAVIRVQLPSSRPGRWLNQRL